MQLRALATLVAIVALGLAPGGAVSHAHPTEAGLSGAALSGGVVFRSGSEGYDTFRIPSIIRTPRNTLLAFAEGRRTGAGDTGDIDLVLKRSVDNGRSWSPLRVIGDNGPNTFGNPTPVVDPRSGDVVLLSTHNAGDASEHEIVRGEVPPEDSRRVWVQRSTDDGLTWSTPADVTPDTKRANWRWYATGPVHAVALPTGRLVVPANHSAAPPEGSTDTGDEDKYYGAHLLYSDDGGRTWQIGAEDTSYEGYINSNETTVAVLPDGRLYVNSRDQHGSSTANRAVAYSDDGGETFRAPFAPADDLVAPVVQGSTLQHSDGPLLFAAPGRADARAQMTLRISTDSGASWADWQTISTAPAAYSDLVELPGGDVGLLYETGESRPYETITFRRVARP